MIRPRLAWRLPLSDQTPQTARILILVVAYEAESTLAEVLRRIPDQVFAHGRMRCWDLG